MQKNSLTGTSIQRPRILFVYLDKRATYLVEELANKINLIDVFKVKINWKKPFFWMNLLLCMLDIVCTMMKKGTFVKVNRRMLYVNSIRRPAFIRRMSSEVEKHINTMTEKPDLILQWQSIFAPYVEKVKVPFALIVDNYTDPPNSVVQKDRLRGWSTFYSNGFYLFQKRLFSDAIRIFTLSQWCKEGLTKEYGIEPDKIDVIGWGPAKKVDTSRSIEKDERRILAVGNDYRAKGLDVLLESACYLKDFSVTIVGKDPAFRHFGVPRNVKIMDYLSDEALVSLYLKSELFFIFSQFDPSPHTLWEAQAHGCVVVGYRAYGISEATIEGKTGILLDTRNPMSVAEEIRKLYQDKNNLKLMQRAAVENYARNGTWDSASKKIRRSLNTIFKDTTVERAR